MTVYDSARFLIERPYETFHIGYPRFAFPSARDMCVMAMADRLQDLEFNIDLALEFGDADPKPLPPFPLVNTGDGWRNWIAPPGSTLERLLARRQFAYLFNGYASQARHLQEELQEAGDFVRVESFRKWPGSSDELPKFVYELACSHRNVVAQSRFHRLPGSWRLARRLE